MNRKQHEQFLKEAAEAFCDDDLTFEPEQIVEKFSGDEKAIEILKEEHKQEQDKVKTRVRDYMSELRQEKQQFLQEKQQFEQYQKQWSDKQHEQDVTMYLEQNIEKNNTLTRLESDLQEREQMIQEKQNVLDEKLQHEQRESERVAENLKLMHETQQTIERFGSILQQVGSLESVSRLLEQSQKVQQDKVAEQKATIEKNATIINEQQYKIAKLDEQFEDERAQATQELLEQIDQQKTNLSELQEQYDYEHNRYETVVSEHEQTLKDIKKSHRTQLNESKEQIKDLLDQVDQLKQARESTHDEVKAGQDEIISLQEQIEQLRQEHDKRANESANTIDQLAERINKQNDILRSKNKDIESREAKLYEIMSEHRELTLQIEQMTGYIKSKEPIDYMELFKQSEPEVITDQPQEQKDKSGFDFDAFKKRMQQYHEKLNKWYAQQEYDRTNAQEMIMEARKQEEEEGGIGDFDPEGSTYYYCKQFDNYYLQDGTTIQEKITEWMTANPFGTMEDLENMVIEVQKLKKDGVDLLDPAVGCGGGIRG